jgi:tRNA(Ile)-lysidine synthase
MQNVFLKYIKENHLVKKGDRVLLAVSGGIDSMVMTDLFVRTAIEVGIAHCNFCLRGRESDKDEELVKKFADKHNIPFYSIRFKTTDYAEKKGISIQMAARDLRYSWFEKTRHEYGYDSVAVAHNLNDNIETLLINLTRGTGIAGLTGMKMVNNRIIRPLLFATRESIVEYCKRQKIEYREDRSNADSKYTRNKIRHLVIPLLKEINPSIEYTLNDTAERMSGINDIVSGFIEKIVKATFEYRDDKIAVNISLLQPYQQNKTILFELFRPFGITTSTLKDFINIIAGRTGSRLFTATHRIVKDRNEIIISSGSQKENEEYKINSVAELKKVPGILSVKNINFTRSYPIPTDPCIACIDIQDITYPLIIREWHSGDFFFPFGMNRKKKLSDYFVDRKFSRFDKEKVLILESAGRIVWIIGERIDNRFRITESTKKALIIKVRSSLAIASEKK